MVFILHDLNMREETSSESSCILYLSLRYAIRLVEGLCPLDSWPSPLVDCVLSAGVLLLATGEFVDTMAESSRLGLPVLSWSCPGLVC